MENITQFLTNHPMWALCFRIFVIVVAIFIINIIIRIAFILFEKKLSHKSEILRIFYHAINKPLRIITWIIGLWVILTQAITWQRRAFLTILDISYMAVKVLVILSIAWALFSFAKELKSYFIKKNTRTDGGYNDFSMIETIHKAAQFVIVLFAFFSVLSALNIPLMALAGMTTVIAGFVAISQQELIKNLFGGVVLYLDRPFSVGDWIYTVTGNIQGTVEKISFRLTVIRSLDKRPIYVPNSMFLSTAVVNGSRMTNRRILQYIGIRYVDFPKLPNILQDVNAMLKNHPDIDTKLATLACMVNGSTNMGGNIEGVFGSSSVNFMVSCFTITTNRVEFQAIQDNIMVKVADIIANHNAEIAFPTTTLDFPLETIDALKR